MKSTPKSYLNQFIFFIIYKYGIGKFIMLIGCLVFPVLSVVFCNDTGLGRLVGVLIAFNTGIAGCFWYSLNPKIKYIKKGAKLEKHPKAIPYVRFFIRLVFLTIGIVLLFSMLLPLLADSVDIAGGKSPETITGTITLVTEPFPLLEFFSQELQVNADGTKSIYYFYFPLQPRLNKGKKYEFVYLPRSHIILKVIPANN